MHSSPGFPNARSLSELDRNNLETRRRPLPPLALQVHKRTNGRRGGLLQNMGYDMLYVFE